MRKLTIIAAMSIILATLNSEKSWSSSSDLEQIQKDISSLTEKIHEAITGPRTVLPNADKNDSRYFFQKPESIYVESRQHEVGKSMPAIFKKVITDENYLNSTPVDKARQIIDERSRYAAIVDKAVNLQIFEETESRLEKIVLMLREMPKMDNLKKLKQLHTQIKTMLVMVKNEEMKLQTIAHSRNTEKVLINRLKRKRNIQILGSINKNMPKIRSS